MTYFELAGESISLVVVKIELCPKGESDALVMPLEELVSEIPDEFDAEVPDNPDSVAMKVKRMVRLEWEIISIMILIRRFLDCV